ncbi:helix-turn-helix domain-containing protein, partial [Anaerococcus sp.]|nr:AraC family transcriptional regulator [Anaerococcus sp.]
MKYLNNLRMIKAQEFLINTDNDIIQISNVLGYTDPSNFT